MAQVTVKLLNVVALSIVVEVPFCGGLFGKNGSPCEQANPIIPIPDPVLGISIEEGLPTKLTEFPDLLTPDRVRQGRWLFFEKRLSADNTFACATCHRSKNAFAEPVPVSTGMGGQKGGRKAPSFVNQTCTKLPHVFWDPRAALLEEQAIGPMINLIENGNKSHDVVVAKLSSISSCAKHFKEAFGTEEITIEWITKVLADYERTRMRGNSR